MIVRLLGIARLSLVLLASAWFRPHDSQSTSHPAGAPTYDHLIAAGKRALLDDRLTDALVSSMAAVHMENARFEAYALTALVFRKKGDSAAALSYVEQALKRVPSGKREALETFRVSLQMAAASRPTDAAPHASQSILEEAQRAESLGLRSRAAECYAAAWKVTRAGLIGLKAARLWIATNEVVRAVRILSDIPTYSYDVHVLQETQRLLEKLAPSIEAEYESLLEQATRCLLEGRFEDCDRNANESIILRPKSIAPRVLLARMHSLKKDIRRAIGAPQDCLKIDPQFSIQLLCQYYELLTLTHEPLFTRFIVDAFGHSSMSALSDEASKWILNVIMTRLRNELVICETSSGRGWDEHRKWMMGPLEHGILHVLESEYRVSEIGNGSTREETTDYSIVLSDVDEMQLIKDLERSAAELSAWRAKDISDRNVESCLVYFRAKEGRTFSFTSVVRKSCGRTASPVTSKEDVAGSFMVTIAADKYSRIRQTSLIRLLAQLIQLARCSPTTLSFPSDTQQEAAPTER